MASINASTAGVGGVITTADNTGILNIQTAGTTAVTINASQNVGVGTTSPVGKLSVSLGTATSSGAPATWDSTYAVFGSSGSTTGTAVGIGYGTGGGYILALSPSVAWQTMNYRASGHIFYTADTERMRLTSTGLLQFESGYGSVATAYGCRAWVNFNGTGTVAIRGSGNVSSITDNGVGQYRVNFTTAMPDANYAVEATSHENTSGLGSLALTQNSTVLAGSVGIITATPTTLSTADSLFVYVAIFR